MEEEAGDRWRRSGRSGAEVDMARHVDASSSVEDGS